MIERNAIVHIGTHKTGTTSLQLFFDANRDRFATEGIYITQGGRFGHLPGNHHIAWELLSSDVSPHLDALVAEVRAVEQPTVLLSAEDFSLLFARPAALDRLREGLELAGFTATIVVYLRAQAPYVESMYIERIKHKYVRPFASYLDTILRDGVYIPDGSPIHLEFDYPRLLAPFVRAFGKDRVVVRPYVATPDSVHIFRDFLGVVASINPIMAQTPIHLTVPQGRANDSLTFYDLLNAAHEACDAFKTTGRTSLEEIVSASPSITEPFLADRVRLLQRNEVEQLQVRFANDNLEIARDFGITVTGTQPEDIAADDAPGWIAARKQRALFDMLIDKWATGKTTADQRSRE